LRYNGFQDRLLKPLGHSSRAILQKGLNHSDTPPDLVSVKML
jgi:hypothetical protein